MIRLHICPCSIVGFFIRSHHILLWWNMRLIYIRNQTRFLPQMKYRSVGYNLYVPQRANWVWNSTVIMNLTTDIHESHILICLISIDIFLSIQTHVCSMKAPIFHEMTSTEGLSYLKVGILQVPKTQQYLIKFSSCK